MSKAAWFLVGALIPVACGGVETVTTSGAGGAASASSTRASSSHVVSSVSAGGGGGGGGQIISMGNDNSEEAETSVAAASNGFVAAAWIAIGSPSAIGAGISQDDGATWSQLQYVESPGGRLASDPVLAVGADSAFYLTWVGYSYDGVGNLKDMHIYAAKAEPGATEFGDPVEASDPNFMAGIYDKPWITVTNSGSVLIGWASDTSLFVARSADAGATWSQAEVVGDDGIFRNFSFLCVPKTGTRIYLTYLAFTSAIDVHLAHSDDDGASWNGATDLLVTKPGDSVAIDDPTCVADGNDAWVLYGQSHDISQTDSAKSFNLRLAHSADSGATIESTVDAADKTEATMFLHATLAREDDGALDVTYYAGEMDNDDSGWYRRARAATAKSAFSPSDIVEYPITFLGSRSDPKWLGDYNGVFVKKNTLYSTFVNNSTGRSHIEFVRIEAP